MDTTFVFPSCGVVFGHRPCQTQEAKWLLMESVSEKCYRPNMYDIGGTYIEGFLQYWFYYKTEMVGKVFLLHFFVSSRQEGTFNISIGGSSDISFRRKQRVAYITSLLKTHKFENAPDLSQNYLVTYSFSEIEIEVMKGMKFYVPISFDNLSGTEEVKGNVYGALLEDPFGADFVIESSDGKKFNVHKVILSACSEVFKAMLKENTAECQQSYLKMVDVDKHDLHSLIQFLYTGTLEGIEDHHYYNLLMLSDRYNLRGLREISEYALASQINLGNVIETLAVADLYCAENLKIQALKFIKCNNAAIHNRMFEELNSAELIREVCQFLVPK